jgi:hypothetical protein
VRGVGRAVALATAMVLLAVAVAVVVIVALYRHVAPEAECVVALPSDANVGGEFTFTPEQMSNAATIAGVGMKMNLPPHAITVALATALQESKLRNLDGGDRDSVGLFQQRPSQGWGTTDELQNPVFAATAFYQKLMEQPDWVSMPVTAAAQAVQRSDTPDAYAQWETQARAAAAALSGQYPAVLTCRNLAVRASTVELADAAQEQLGTSQLSGPQPPDRGWAMSSWLVSHALDYGIDQVSFAGQTWTAKSGAWTADSAAGTDLSLHQLAAATNASGN